MESEPAEFVGCSLKCQLIVFTQYTQTHTLTQPIFNNTAALYLNKKTIKNMSSDE